MTTVSSSCSPYFHVGIVVADLEAAMRELTNAVGLTWREPSRSQYGAWDIEVSYSVEGPPYLELIRGCGDGPWTLAGAPRIDHIGWATSNVVEESERLIGIGVDVDFDPSSVSPNRSGVFCYHRAPASGVRIELVTGALLDRLQGAS
jgi:hypothetical protein